MIAVSACLRGIPCRYDGKEKENSGIPEMPGEMLLLVCPEVAAGLSIPRAPLEIAGGDGHDVLAGRARVVDREGGDYTDAVLRGVEDVLAMCRQAGVEIAYLTERSPTCGCGRIYTGAFDGNLKAGDGVLAAALKEAGVSVVEVG